MSEPQKKRYVFGPLDESGEPRVLMCLEAAVDELRSRFEDGEVGDDIQFRIVEMTDAEADALPEL